MGVDGAVDTVKTVFQGIGHTLGCIRSAILTILEINYDAMSKILFFLWKFIQTMATVINVISVTVTTVFTCVVEFLVELSHFASMFMQLLWKVLILIYCFLDLVFHSLECLVYFLWTGGQWTAKAVQISSRNLTENGIGTWKYFVSSLKNFTESLIGGFTSLGLLTKEVFMWLGNGIATIFEWLSDGVFYIDRLVRDLAILVYNSIYYFLTDYIMKMPKEAYLGFIVGLASLIIIKNAFHRLCDRGLTFPLLSQFQSHFPDSESEDYDDYDGRMAEFSDDDLVDLTLEDDDRSSQMSDSSGEDDNSSDENDEVEELEVDSSDESVAASESEMSEINIVLPRPDGLGRRSATPSRMCKDMSQSDLERAIETEKERRMCVVCQDHTKSVLILPCRHMCLCVDCGNQIARTRMRNRRVCPLCRTRIQTIMNVYL